jgi:diguanylate cyclase (GGDEF)-like protein
MVNNIDGKAQAPRPNLLVVDDNPKNLHSTKRILQELDINIITVESGEDALKAVVNHSFFLILMDVNLPNMSGFEAVTCIHSNDNYKHIPVIFLTAVNKDEIFVKQGYDTGAVDYLIKPISSHILISKVKIFLALNAAHDEMYRLATTDTLTQLPNRAHFQSHELSVLNSAVRNKSIFTILFLDLDNFKEINDTLGHDAGDILLKSVANKIKGCLRNCDTVARMGGDEFAIILSAITCSEDAGVVAKKILKKINTITKYLDNEIRTTASIGIATYPSCGESCAELNKSADIAMYKAKETRNSFQFYNAEIQQKMLMRLLIVQGLYYAIENNEFELHYQPKVDVKSNVIIGMEALLRWNSGKIGVIGPDKFIPIAEDTGQIITIGNWVLKQAMEQAVLWNKDNAPHLQKSMAVNVSVKQLTSKDFINTLKQNLTSSGLAPSLLELEVTETALMENKEYTTTLLNDIHELGVKISIDDFGTGYSSLSYLHKLPIDTIKIDLSFVRAINTDKSTNLIIKAIIDLAHTLGMIVISEGVENLNQVQFLTQLGCDVFQGYYFGKPKPKNCYDAINLTDITNLNSAI